ncbi:MAG TPA: C45 family peptidase [Micromonosporaceae bacterium]|nr:C45 family peptidase [Micromonosporaceae bacterium]
MTTCLPVPVVSVTGTPAQCGAAYGAQTAGLVAQIIEAYHRRFADQAGLTRTAVRAAGAIYQEVTREHHPRVAQMLEGLADGAGVPAEEIYATNARTELIYGSPAQLHTGSAARAAGLARGDGGPGVPSGGPCPDGPDGGCTSLGVLGTHTASGHLLLAQNWDWHPDQRDTMLLLRTTDERGHTVLALTEAGMLAKTGLSSAGVGICVNMLGCDRDGLPPGARPGVPYHVLVRAALEAEHLPNALRRTVRPPRNSSINLLLGQAGSGPEGGEMVNLELVPGDVGWLHPVDGIITHANHFDTPLRVYDTIKDWGGSSLFRAARARRLLTPAALAGKVSEDDLAGVLRDHAGFPLAICRHAEERDAWYDRAETVYSVLLDLDERRMAVAAGPPCTGDYAWVDLLP